VVITRGAEGSSIYTGGEEIALPVVPVEAPVDPTGCGDAYRAGLLYGLEQNLDWPTTGRVASLMGALKVVHHGTQNHAFERDEFGERFREVFGYALY
jgi:adenosine kinase